MDDDTELSLDASYAFMCGKCLHVYPSLEEIETHDCNPVPAGSQQKEAAPGSLIKAVACGNVIEPARDITGSYVTAEVVELDTRTENIVASGGENFDISNKSNIDYIIEGITTTKRERLDDDYDIAEDDDERQRKKKKTYNNDYLLNKLVRDPYFKLDHNSYTFKDTLGDWDERSTRLLIILVGKFPKCHFLLQYYFERRLSHWESIHFCMINAGYNFTVLQLRMRWREIFAKYRWTLNHNDLHEDKKTFEYMKEMNDLFGTWPFEATETLLNLVESSLCDNPSTKHKRLGYMGWERIASALQNQGYKYGTLQVEARWHMLVTTYKSMLDHNIMPTVEPIQAAFSDRLKNLVTYEPRRRRDYEKYKGKKVKLEKFPESAMKQLIKIYENNIPRFFDSKIKSTEIWEDIKVALDLTGYIYPVTKIKEIFFATLKLYERCLQHNAIPGAIKREGPHYKELSEIYGLYGFWPHVKRRKKTQDEKTFKKFSSRLRESMQTWHTEESRALLKLFPPLLENFVSQTATQQPNDLWAQVAQAYEALGYVKRDIPEIATHIGLLRQGYSQGNNFPFMAEMQKLMEVEEALCYSPDVSKYTGDTEITYWSHEAVFLLLDLYLKVQPILPYSSLSNEVFSRLVKEMKKFGYRYTFEDIREEIRTLLYQFTMRKYKPEKSSTENWGKNKSIFMYKDKMMEVMKLRETLAVGFTNGLKPMSNDVMDVVYSVAREKCEALFSTVLTEEEQRERMKLVVLAIRREVRRIIKRKPPAARKICVHLLTALSSFTENPKPSPDIIGLYKCLGRLDYERILSDIMRDVHNGSFKLSRDILKLEKKFVSVESLDEPPDNEDPECILNVNAIKEENQFLDPLDDWQLMDVDKVTRRDSQNSLFLESDSDTFEKLIYIDKKSDLKNTEEESRACIVLDEGEIKLETIDDDTLEEQELVLNSLDQIDAPDDDSTYHETSICSFVLKQLQQIRKEEESVLESFIQQKKEETVQLQALVDQMKEFVSSCNMNNLLEL